jgi:hypothetical protein
VNLGVRFDGKSQMFVETDVTPHRFWQNWMIFGLVLDSTTRKQPTVITTKMAGRKRKNQDSTEEGIYSNKSRSRTSVEAKLDPTYGQRSAIPGLDDDTLYEEEDGYIYDEDMDALAYLRSVR